MISLSTSQEQISESLVKISAKTNYLPPITSLLKVCDMRIVSVSKNTCDASNSSSFVQMVYVSRFSVFCLLQRMISKVAHLEESL